jgi:CAAX protease family protein
MSVIRRILVFPITRLVITLVVFGLLALLFSLILAIPGVPQSTLFSQLALALAAIGALALVAKAIEGRPLAEVGLSLHRAGRDLLLGFLIGGGLISLVVGTLALAGWYRVTGLGWPAAGKIAVELSLWLVLYLLVAVFEETLFRGIIFRAIEDTLGSWVALASTSLFFGLVHLANPNATLIAGIAIALEAGILLGAAYMLTRSLWLVFGIHWAWNFFEGPIYGTAVSGMDQTSLLRSVMDGPEIWTGGAFGPEAGLVAVIICICAGLVILVLAARHGQVRTPDWMRRKRDKPAPSVSKPV